MKHIIILGDGMADHAVSRLGGKTPLQYADTPYMDMLARRGRTGRVATIPRGFMPGSEVANTAILGYDLNEVYEGRGPLEAASIGYEMSADDLALRCNLCTLRDGKIENHHGCHLTTEQGDVLIKHLQGKLGSDRVKFITGIQYRHLLIVRGGNKHIVCAPPHDHPGEPWRPLLVKSEEGWQDKHDGERMTGGETAALLNNLIMKSQELLADSKLAEAEGRALSIWPWSGGYRPSMQTLAELYPQVKSGSVISAVDLIRGIGHYAGLDIVKVEGATGLANTNYEGKAAAAIEALRSQDFVFLHLEATDEAGHDGDLDLKIRAIEYLDDRILRPIYNEIRHWEEPVCIAMLPDHPTPVEMRIHVNEPVPFFFWYRGIEADSVTQYDEQSCVGGVYGLLRLSEFMNAFMEID